MTKETENSTPTNPVIEDDDASINFDAISSTPINDKAAKSEDEKIDIDPEFAIYIIDLFVTRIIAVGGKFAGYEIKVSDIALTKEEIKRIRPHAAKALTKFIAWLEDNFPETWMFILVLIVTYGSKTVLHAKKVEKGKAQKPPATQKPGAKKPTPNTVKRMTRTSKIK